MNEHLNAFSKLDFDKVKKHVQRYAVSDLGREHIDHLSPSSSSAEIKLQLSLVTEMKLLINVDDQLPLETTKDVCSSIHRASIESYILSSHDLHAIANVLTVAKKIKTFFTRKELSYPLLYQKVNQIRLDKVLEYNNDRAIDEEGNVRDSASKELADIRRQIVDRNAVLRKNLQQILKDVAGKDWIQDEIITTRDGRMVIPVKTEHKNRVPGFIHSSSASGLTVFVEPTETLDLNNDIRTLQFQEQREIERILKELTRQVSESRDLILCDVQVLADLDFIQAKAKFSIEILGSEPRIKDGGSILLKEAYHPILLQKHARNEVIPLTLEVGEKANTIVITGPNAGGKSVAMKTVGLLLLMAQAGCHIPASPESEIGIITDVFVEIGDEQSIENDLSSFSSHLTHLRDIIQGANNTSLVLIDEIGSGTDPAEGGSIAAAFLEHLAAAGCITIVTTHHGSLKSIATENPHFENGAMEFDQTTLKPTYRFRAGIPGSSYAIEMAERLQLPASLIERAKGLRGSSANTLERLLVDLERQTQEMRSRLEEIRLEKDRYNALNQLYDQKTKSLEKELKEIRIKALHEGQIIVQRANQAIEKTIREIKEQAASKEIIRSARADILEIEKEFQHMQEDLADENAQQTNFQIGDVVQLRNSTSTGEIVAILDDDYFLVLIGALKVSVRRGELQLSTAREQRQAGRTASIDFVVDAQREIDLRGMYGDEAIQAIEKFFDQAILSGVDKVNLIHGKGTGALRRKINDYLKKNASIKSYRLGEWNEGGTGVTVVELQ